MNRREMPRDVTILGRTECVMVPAYSFTSIKMAVFYVFYIIPWELYHYTIHDQHREMCLSML